MRIAIKMLYDETKLVVYYPTRNNYLINIKWMRVIIIKWTQSSQTSEFYQIIDQKWFLESNPVFWPRLKDWDVFFDTR